MKLSFTQSGNKSGKRIIFLHGYMENSTMWKDILPNFSDFECVCIDLYGHGKSTIQKKKFPENLGLQAEAILNLILTFSDKETYLVGHSLGGYLCLELLKLEPEKFNKVILFHSHPWEDSPEKKIDRERVAKFVQTKKSFFISEAIPMLFKEENRTKEYVSEYIQMANGMTAEAIAWSAIAMKNRSNYLNLFVHYPSKISVIQGEFDALIPIDKMRECCEKLNIELFEINDVAHMSHVEAPKDAISAVEKILSSVSMIE